MRVFPLQPTKQKLFHGKVHGFDIETCDKGLTFLCATYSMHDGSYIKCFTKQEVIHALKHDNRFKGSIVSCTNCGYDFFGSFFDTPDIANFQVLFRQSHLIYAKTFIRNNELRHERGNYKKEPCYCTFIDTLNFAPYSVKKLGEIINIPKMEYAELGKRPKSDKQFTELLDYNANDALISRQYMMKLIRDFESLGATFKNTLASTAMSLFRNKYLLKKYYTHHPYVLKELFKGYYGGRTEAFSRGITGECYYYDFNSMYPAAMLNEFPDPSTLKIDYHNIDRVRHFEGISHVRVFCPDMKYPVLPFRNGTKTIFPTGTFTGYYCHNELRYAVEQGYVIMDVYKSYYFLRTTPIFRNYVTDLYELRKKMKLANDPMEVTVKLLMNGLYGKFAQSFIGMDDWVHKSQVTIEMIEECPDFEQLGDYYRFRQAEVKPAIYCFPELSAYVTAYGRIMLHRKIIETKPYYVDTDSLMTTAKIPHSLELGDLKLEMGIISSVIVKPKFYAFYGMKYENGKIVEIEDVKIKGFARVNEIVWQGQRMRFSGKKKFFSFMEFIGFLNSPKAAYEKISKFKEAMRRCLKPNQEFVMEKKFVLDDDKRVWQEHDMCEIVRNNMIVDSVPICIK